MKFNYADILEECANVARDRQAQYGEATESMALASNILRESFGVEMSPATFSQAMVALKLSRLKFKFKEDSVIDIINYFAIALACKRQEDGQRQQGKKVRDNVKDKKQKHGTGAAYPQGVVEGESKA
jgi:hypothetical protein